MQCLIQMILTFLVVYFITKIMLRHKDILDEIEELENEIRKIDLKNHENECQIHKICQKIIRMQDGKK